MYRVCFTYIGNLNTSEIWHGMRREIQFATTYAFTAYDNWLKVDYAKDVTLEMWTNGAWKQIKP